MLGAGLGAFGGSMLQGDPWQQALAGGALAAGTTGLFGGILGSGDDLISKTAADAVAAPTLGPTQNIGAFAGPGSGFYQEGVGVGSDGFSNFLVDSSGVAIAPNFSAPVNVANAFSPQALSEGALDASKSFYPLPIGPLQGAVPTVVSPDAMAVGRAAVDKAGFGDRLRAGIGAYDFASPEALASYGLVGAGWAGDGMNALTGTPTAVIPDFTKDKVNIPEQFPVLRASLTPPSGYRPGIDPEFRFFNPINRLAAQGGLVRKYKDGGLADRVSTGVGAFGGQVVPPQILSPEQPLRYGGPIPQASGFDPVRTQRPATRMGLMRRYADGGIIQGFHAGRPIPPFRSAAGPIRGFAIGSPALRTINTPPPGFRHGFQPQFNFFANTQTQIPNASIPIIPGHTLTAPLSSPKIVPPLMPSTDDGGDNDTRETDGRSDVGLDEARNVSSFTNSLLGKGLALALPGGGIVYGGANLAANAAAANALGVNVPNTPFGPSPAMDAVNATNLTTAEFDTPEGTNVPSIQGINRRMHDPSGSPRNEAGTVGIDASFAAMADAEAQEADEANNIGSYDADWS